MRNGTKSLSGIKLSKKGISKTRHPGEISKSMTWKINDYIGYLSLGLLLVICMMTLLPISSYEGHATDGTGTGEMRTNVNVAPVVSVAMQSTIDVDVTPKQNGSYAMSTAKLTVATNSDNGYSVYIKSGSSDTNSLVSTDNTNTKQISATDSTSPLNAMANNTWGYSLSTNTITEQDNFFAVPLETSSAIATTDKDSVNLAQGNTYNLAFGVNIDTTLPAGQYTGSVIISAVANPITVTSLYQLTYMQDMTPEICANTGMEVTKQLIDTRDGKSYWVAKLKDDNCWMTQNLALDLIEGKTYTSADTDLANTTTKSWTVPISTEYGVPEKTAQDNNSMRSWNLGKAVLINPTSGSSCSQELPSELEEQGYTAMKGASVYHGYSLVDICTNQFRNVAGWSDTYSASQTRAIDEATRQYDAHYLVGNYYSWGAATASTGLSLDPASSTAGNTDPSKLMIASSSICPAGWKLPTDGRYNMSNAGWPFDLDDSFYRLLHAYGYPETGNSSTGNNPVEGWKTGVNSNTLLTGNGITRIDYAPIYYVRAGYVTIDGALMSAGGIGYGWSSVPTPGTNSSVYNIEIYGTVLYPAASYSRSSGLALRCLAR